MTKIIISTGIEDPTSKGDRVAALMRDFYEKNHKTLDKGLRPDVADNLMIGLINIVRENYDNPAQTQVAQEMRRALEVFRMGCEMRWQAGDFPSEEMLAITATKHLRDMKPYAEKAIAAWDKIGSL